MTAKLLPHHRAHHRAQHPPAASSALSSRYPATRRTILKGLGAFGATSAAAGFPLRVVADSAPGLVFPLAKGPFQNNGATPWYANLPLGTPGQSLKFALDTGSNFNWVTSSLCSETGNGCKHWGGQEFNYNKSSSFAWVDKTLKPVSFGPWGTMTVATGRDQLALPGGQNALLNTYLSQSYSGDQFLQLDWDGGIGLPSGTPYRDTNTTFIVPTLMRSGAMDPEMPYVCFDTDAASRTGTCRMGGLDYNAYDPTAWIFMPWKAYTAFPDVAYIWTSPLSRFIVGSQTVATNAMFSLDSGSSQFKGDDNIMNRTLALIAGTQPRPDVNIFTGMSSTGGAGQITIPPSVYDVLIQAGPDAGKVIPQFKPLGLTDLVLVGSVLMDLFYTIFEYKVTRLPGGYNVNPVGMWIFNKRNGPQLIKSGGKPAMVGQRKPIEEEKGE